MTGVTFKKMQRFKQMLVLQLLKYFADVRALEFYKSFAGVIFGKKEVLNKRVILS